MEEIIDLAEFLKNLNIPEPEYAAVYDKETGKVLSVGPSHAFEDVDNKVIIDKEVAIDILENRILIERCFIDPRTKKPIITEVRSLRKIDDILHRVTNVEWATADYFDLYISYDRKKKMLKLQLAEELGGTKKIGNRKLKSNIALSGETLMNFMITDYNDPNIEYEAFSVSVSELVGKTKKIENIELPDFFSVYTCRLFDNYVLEVK